MSNPVAFLNGEYVPLHEAKVGIMTHALHYGTGAFGGMRAIPDPSDSSNILRFRADRHAKRLNFDTSGFLEDPKLTRKQCDLRQKMYGDKPKNQRF